MDLIRTVERLLAPLRRRVMLMIGRAVLLRIDDSQARQLLQIEGLLGEVMDAVERIQEYGFSSVPPAGAEVLVAAPGGMRQHPIAGAVEDARVRPTSLPSGTVILYTDQDGGIRRPARQRLILQGETDRRLCWLITRGDGDSAGLALVGTLLRPAGATARLRAAVGDSRGNVDVTPSDIRLSVGETSIVMNGRSIRLRAGATVMRIEPPP